VQLDFWQERPPMKIAIVQESQADSATLVRIRTVPGHNAKAQKKKAVTTPLRLFLIFALLVEEC
jgi:hypothetical protein